MKMKKRLLSVLLTLAMVVSTFTGIVPGMSMTAYASTLNSESTTWSENSDIVDNVTINNNVTVDADITLTIPEGKTLTINGQSDYVSSAAIQVDYNLTLTVSGRGTLIVNAPAKEDGHPALVGIYGNLIVDGATVQVTGGADGISGNVTVKSGLVCVNGNNGKNGYDGNSQGSGGYSGIDGNVIVNGGSITVVGGNGGDGYGDLSSGDGGDGGFGVVGDIIVNGGSATITGGNGGTKGSSSFARNGYFGQAVSGTITGNAEESEDNTNWTSVTGRASQKQYIKFEPILVTGVSLDETTAQTIDVDGKVSFTATVIPENASDKTVKWSVGGTNATAVKLYSDENCTTEVGTDATSTLTVYAKGISAGNATVTCTSNADSEKSASCDVAVNEAVSDDPYASLLNTTTVVKFDNKDWYLIENNSTAADAGTVTLLSKECVNKSAYNSSGIYVAYSNNPTIKGVVDSWYNDNISQDAKGAVFGNGMFLLESEGGIDTNVLKCDQYGDTEYNEWWLCSPGASADRAACVDGDYGYRVSGSPVGEVLGVRPALKLDLSKVTFDSENNTFSVKSSQDENTTYNPGSTYTGFGDLNTNDSEVTISEVSGITWYVIASDSSTVTLLSKQSFGNQKFNSSVSKGNNYETSDIKTYVEGLTGERQSLAGIKDALADVSVTDPVVTGKVPYLLSQSEAGNLSSPKKIGASTKTSWWLRSQGIDAGSAAFVDGSSGVIYDYGAVSFDGGVRPALKLDLSKVTFDSATNTFAILPYPLWVGGVQVTSANKDDVLGDTDEGATVVFTPAVDDNAATTDVDESRPATLTLNSAIINGGNSDSEYAAIYAKGLDLTINVTGDSTVTGPKTNDPDNSEGIDIDDGCLTIAGSGRLTTKGGESADGCSYGIDVDRAVTINGSLNASGGESQGAESCGIYAYDGITVGSSGTLAASGGTGEAGSYGIWAKVTVDGSLSAIGNSQAIYGTVKNSIAGTGWTDKEGTTGKASIAVSEAWRELNSYKKVQFPAVHEHSFTYEANGATITATCTDGCDITEGLTLTISAPTELNYDGNTKAATLNTGYDTTAFPGQYTIKYYQGTSEVEAANVKAAGDYTAKVTVGDATAGVDFTIYKATSSIETIPTASAITYGQTLKNSTLTGGVVKSGEANVEGTFAWKNTKTKPDVSDSMTTEYDVVFTPTDGNYDSAESKVKLTVNKADSSVAKAPTANTLNYNGKAQELVTAGTAEGGTMQYALGKDASTAPTEGWSTFIPTANNAGIYYIWYKVVGDENHLDSDAACVTSKIRADISKTVTFKVVNGSWNDGEAKDKVVKIEGFEGDTLKLSADKIPAVGTKPSDGYKEGSWDVVPKADTEIKADTTFTYTYAKKEEVKPDPESVQKTKLTVTAKDQTIAFGAAISQASSKYTIKGLQTGDEAKVTLKADMKKFTITPVVTVKNGDKDVTDAYDITAVSANIAISQVPMVVAISKGKSITATLTKIKNVDGYLIYTGYCGGTSKLVKTIKGNKAVKYTYKKINGKALDRKKASKVIVKAYRLVDGKNVVVATSMTAHVAGVLNKKLANASSVTVAKKNIELKSGKTANVDAKVVLTTTKKAQLSKGHAAEIRYASSNTAIATVDAKGKIAAKGKGKCTVYAVAVDGTRTTVNVKVE